MAIKIYINGIEYGYKHGLSSKEKLSEDLNEGVIFLPQQEELDIQPYDTVEIYDEDVFLFNGYLSYYELEISSYDEFKYNYTITVTSLTKDLQSIYLPNKEITQSLFEEGRTIYDVAVRFVEVYARNYTFTQEFIDKTSQRICPELQWNKPTLFEVFNDLLAVIGCVLRVPEKNKIGLLDLNERGNEIDLSLISTIKYSQSAEEYNSGIESDVENVIGDRKNTISQGYIFPKTNEDPIMSTNNAKIILDKPIYTIDKVIVMIEEPQQGKNYVVYVDITKQIIDKKVWNLKKASNSLGYAVGTKNRRNYLFYEEGGYSIEGLNFKESDWSPVGDAHTALRCAIFTALGNDFRIKTGGEFTVDLDLGRVEGTGAYKVGFYVEWTSLDNVKYTTAKDKLPRNARMLQNNQTSSYVNFDFYSKNMQETTNRLGNKEREIFGQCDTASQVPKLNDHIGDYKLVEIEYTVFDTYVNFKGVMIENFSKRNLFTSINARKRFTEIATGETSLISHHTNKYRLFFSFEQETPSGIRDIVNYFVQVGVANEKVTGGIFQFEFENYEKTPYILKSATSYHSKKSLVFSFKMEDNFSAGIRLEIDDNFFGVKSHNITYAPYVDEQGEFKEFYFKLYKGFEDFISNKFKSPTQEAWWGQEYNEGDFEKAYGRKINLPYIEEDLIDPEDIVFETPNIKRNKNNREITAETFQFDFIGNESIFVLESYLEDNIGVCKKTQTVDLVVYVSTSYTYDEFDTNKVGNYVQVNVAFVNNEIQFTIDPNETFNDWENVTSFAVCENGTGKPYLLVNGNIRNIYLNLEPSDYIIEDEDIVIVNQAYNLDMIEVQQLDQDDSYIKESVYDVSFDEVKQLDFENVITIKEAYDVQFTEEIQENIDEVLNTIEISQNIEFDEVKQLNQTDIPSSLKTAYVLNFNESVQMNIDEVLSDLESAYDMTFSESKVEYQVEEEAVTLKEGAYDMTMTEEKDMYEDVWELIGTSGPPYDDLINFGTQSSDPETCRTETQIHSLLTTLYPPENYVTGFIVRVEHNYEVPPFGEGPCTPYYYRKVEQPL